MPFLFLSFLFRLKPSVRSLPFSFAFLSLHLISWFQNVIRFPYHLLLPIKEIHTNILFHICASRVSIPNLLELVSFVRSAVRLPTTAFLNLVRWFWFDTDNIDICCQVEIAHFCHCRCCCCCCYRYCCCYCWCHCCWCQCRCRCGCGCGCGCGYGCRSRNRCRCRGRCRY